jgi:hypothetical protein
LSGTEIDNSDSQQFQQCPINVAFDTIHGFKLLLNFFQLFKSNPLSGLTFYTFAVIFSQLTLEILVELFGGLMVIFWIIGFSLTVIWFILPFVIFAIKGRVDDVLSRLEYIEKRLTSIEKQLQNRRAD